jgi:hypothetical protein
MVKASNGTRVSRIVPYVTFLLGVCGLLIALRAAHTENEVRTYWIEHHNEDQARIDTISSAVVKANDQKIAAIDEGVKNSKAVIILGKDNRGLDGGVEALFENDQLVMIKADSGSGDSEVTIRYYLENERDPLVVAHTEVKKDGPAPHQETYRWYFAGGDYVTFRFSNPDESNKFSPLDRPEDIADIRSKIAYYLEILGMKEPKSAVPHNV